MGKRVRLITSAKGSRFGAGGAADKLAAELDVSGQFAHSPLQMAHVGLGLGRGKPGKPDPLAPQAPAGYADLAGASESLWRLLGERSPSTGRPGLAGAP